MRIAMRLDRERFESWYCASRWSGGEPATEAGRRAVADLRDAGVHAIGLGRSGARSLSGWGSLVRLMRRERIDVLHAHKFGSNAWGAVLAPLGRVPVLVAHEHTWSYEGQPLRRFVDRELIARRSAAFVAVSREDRRRMIEVERIPPEAVTFVPNGIDALPAGDGARARQELGVPDGAPLLGAVAVLREQKGLDVLVRALAGVIESLRDARLVVAGEGPERASLEALAAQLGIGPRVLLLGNRSDVPDLLAAFDVAVSASWFEGSPLAAMEYMDAGLPIVATRVGGMPDLIDDGVHGRLVAPGDAAGLAAAVVELLRDPERARAMGAAARERRRAEFDLDGTVRTLEQMYERLVAERGRRS
jgi:glycosyltransferase involved in cell wall biosynthesis